MATGELPAAELARYRELVGGNGLRDDEKDQVIRIVANIMQAFVDIACQNYPTQSSPIESTKFSSQEDSVYDSIHYIQTLKSDFAAVVRLEPDSTNAKDVPNGSASSPEGRHLLPR